MNFIERIRKLFEIGRVSARERMQKRARRAIRKIVSVCENEARDGVSRASCVVIAPDNRKDLLALFEEELVAALVEAGITSDSCSVEEHKELVEFGYVPAFKVVVVW